MKKMIAGVCVFAGLGLSAVGFCADVPLKTVGVTVGDLSNPFFVQIGKGIEAAARKFGGDDVKVSLVSSGYDLERQVAQMDSFVAAKVDLIILSAADSKGIAPAVRKAKAAGITVVAIDSGAEGGVDAIVMSNNFLAGEQSCTYIAERLEGKGKVVIINGPPITSAMSRVEGCKKVFEAYPGITILSDDRNAGGSREGGLRIMTELLKQYPDIDAVFAINDPTAVGAELAAKQTKRTDLFIASVDGAPDAEKSIRSEDGLLVATSAQDPRQMAETAVKVGYRFMQGKKQVNIIISIPTYPITKDNIDTYEGWNSETDSR